MEINFKKDRFLVFFFMCLGAILSVLLACLLFLWTIEQKENKSNQEAYDSLKISNELRQSSDDLTKMIRLYVLTGDKRYIQYYDEILSIRNGTTPRPIDYDEVYWDFVLDDQKRPRGYGRPVSFMELMRENSFSKEEFDLLEQSQLESDALVKMEVEAINVMQGFFQNGSGDYSVVGTPNEKLARELVSNQSYMKEKAKIMEPLLLFSLKVKERTLFKIEELRKLAIALIVSAFILSIFASIFMVICLLKAFKALKEVNMANEKLLLNMLPKCIVERLKVGEENIFNKGQGSILFAHIRHFTESFSVETLTEVLECFENLAQQFEIEKIKIMGDSFMAAAGIPVVVSDHAIRLANFSLALKDKIEEFNRESGLDLALRIGMSSGLVSAGIIGRKKFIYDMWGDVVTEASFLESSGEVGEILISEEMAKILSPLFILEERRNVKLKKEGEAKTFFLKGRILI